MFNYMNWKTLFKTGGTKRKSRRNRKGGNGTRRGGGHTRRQSISYRNNGPNLTASKLAEVR